MAQSETLNFLSERGIAVLPFVNERDGLQAIVDNKIDAFVYNELVLKYLLRTEFPARVQVLPGIFDSLLREHGGCRQAASSANRLTEPCSRSCAGMTGSSCWRGMEVLAVECVK